MPQKALVCPVHMFPLDANLSKILHNLHYTTLHHTTGLFPDFFVFLYLIKMFLYLYNVIVTVSCFLEADVGNNLSDFTFRVVAYFTLEKTQIFVQL